MEKNIVSVWQNVNDQLMGFVMSKVKNKDDSKDIVQDVFVKVFSKIDTLKNEDKVVSWIFQITRNTINDYFRKNKFTQKESSIDQNTSYLMSPEEETVNQFANCVTPMINNLPQKYKEALFLSEIEGISQKELAVQLGLSYTGTKSRIQRGRKKLKEMLLACCTIQVDKFGNVFDYESKNCSDKC